MKKNKEKSDIKLDPDLIKAIQILASELPPKRSGRVYPERPCVNPNCSFDGKFIPRRKNHKFCVAQCRINFHNDRYNLDANTTFLDAKKLIENDKKLLKIYNKYVDAKGYCEVMKEIFHYEGIDVMLLSRELQNSQTKGKVKQYFRFGIERHPSDQNYYIIHKIETL